MWWKEKKHKNIGYGVSRGRRKKSYQNMSREIGCTVESRNLASENWSGERNRRLGTKKITYSKHLVPPRAHVVYYSDNIKYTWHCDWWTWKGKKTVNIDIQCINTYIVELELNLHTMRLFANIFSVGA